MNGRTFSKLNSRDLGEIVPFALEEFSRFLNVAGSPRGKYRRYADRLIGIFLAQGAAQHFTDLEAAPDYDLMVEVELKKIQDKGLRVLPTGQVVSGIKDIDVWFLFEDDATLHIPPRTNCRKSVIACLEHFGNIDLDFMKKGVAQKLVEFGRGDPRKILRAYLADTAHGRSYLSKKSLVGLYPEHIFAQVLWRVHRVTQS